MGSHPMPYPDGSRTSSKGHRMVRGERPGREQDRGPGSAGGWTERPRRRQGERELAVLDPTSTPPASCPAFLGRRKANRRPTSGCAVTSEAGLGPVAIWAGGQPQVRQEGVALAQRLQLLALTQRGPCAVLGTQRGLGRCRAGTHTHIHTERDTPLEGPGAAECGPGPKPDARRGANSLLTTF